MSSKLKIRKKKCKRSADNGEDRKSPQSKKRPEEKAMEIFEEVIKSFLEIPDRSHLIPKKKSSERKTDIITRKKNSEIDLKISIDPSVDMEENFEYYFYEEKEDRASNRNEVPPERRRILNEELGRIFEEVLAPLFENEKTYGDITLIDVDINMVVSDKKLTGPNYKCPLCKCELRNDDAVLHHICNVAKVLKNIPCDFCDKHYKTYDEWKHNIRYHFNREDCPYFFCIRCTAQKFKKIRIEKLKTNVKRLVTEEHKKNPFLKF